MVIHSELCIQLRLDYANQTQSSQCSRKKKKSKIILEFKVQTTHPIEARKPDLVIRNKEMKICQVVDFTVSADHQVKLKVNEKLKKAKK